MSERNPTSCLCCSFAQERIRQRQERNISGMREGLAEGGEALGMGFYRGVTGLVSKPLEGAQSRGALGAPLSERCQDIKHSCNLSSQDISRCPARLQCATVLARTLLRMLPPATRRHRRA